MSNWLVSRLRRVLRQRNVSTRSRLVAGNEVGEEIHIDSLIYPLRYDVIVRAEFLAYCQQNRETYTHDFERFLSNPIAQAYYLSWFTDASRSRPHLGFDKVAMQQEFALRVHRAIKLFDSLEVSGFDQRYPIELRAATKIKHENDKRVERNFYAGNGCHRLAFLASKGMKTLTPSHYCVRVFEEFQPRDNTYLLVGKVLRTEKEYCRAMSGYYCNGKEYDDACSILEHVKHNNPAQLDEAASVLRVDLRPISGIGGDEERTYLEASGNFSVPKS